MTWKCYHTRWIGFRDNMPFISAKLESIISPFAEAKVSCSNLLVRGPEEEGKAKEGSEMSNPCLILYCQNGLFLPQYDKFWLKRYFCVTDQILRPLEANFRIK